MSSIYYEDKEADGSLDVLQLCEAYVVDSVKAEKNPEKKIELRRLLSRIRKALEG